VPKEDGDYNVNLGGIFHMGVGGIKGVGGGKRGDKGVRGGSSVRLNHGGETGLSGSPLEENFSWGDNLASSKPPGGGGLGASSYFLHGGHQGL